MYTGERILRPSVKFSNYIHEGKGHENNKVEMSGKIRVNLTKRRIN